VLSALLVALALPVPRQAPAPPPERVERRLAAMGTWLELALELEAGDSPADARANALAASEAAVRALEACEARLTTWSDASELARLNRAAVGERVELSPALAADLARAAHFWRATGGTFDPGLGALVEAWGLRTGGRRPSPEELSAARACGGFAGFELAGTHAVRRHPLARIEEGGFGKGLGLDHARAALVAAGARSAVLDLGGQLLVLGAPHTTTLADPRDRARPVLELECAPGSLSTSGNSERGIRVDGMRLGHLLDPRTGEPAPDFGSLSVWAPDATAADCLSTGLYVLGPEAAFRWRATAGADIELVVLEPRPDGSLAARASARLRGKLRALVPELELTFEP
jgi:FAD:protein FMN transferase